MKYAYLILTLLFFACKNQQVDTPLFQNEALKITQLTKNTFLHTSYLETQNYGKVPCNGIIVIDKGEAIIVDTPTNNEAATALINWVKKSLRCNVKAVVVTHFHIDCLGGLAAFYDKKIPSYANRLTTALALEDAAKIPNHSFENYLELQVGNKILINEFLGEGHTKDNIVSYFPSEKVLFGGCLIKSIGSGKGNLADANTGEWSATVMKVKAKYGEAEVVIPGHGKTGDSSLLDFTIELFK